MVFRSKRKQYIIKQFVKENKVDILFLQETFVDNNYVRKIGVFKYLSGAKNTILNFILDPNLDKIGGNLTKGTPGSKTFKTILEKLQLLDYFRYLYPLKRSVICLMGSNVGTRLDRFYIYTLIKESVASFETLPCACSDHNYIVMNLASNIGKSYWKINDELLNGSDFLSSFEYFWNLISRTDTITLKWWDKIKEQIKLFCIDYSKQKNRKQYGDLKNFKKQFVNLEMKEESDLHKYNEIKLKVKEIENKILKGSPRYQ